MTTPPTSPRSRCSLPWCWYPVPLQCRRVRWRWCRRRGRWPCRRYKDCLPKWCRTWLAPWTALSSSTGWPVVQANGLSLSPRLAVASYSTYYRSVLQKKGWLLACLLNIPATCECISGTDLLRQFYVLPHWDRSSRSNFPSHPVTVYWHRADQSQRWPYNARRLEG